MSFLTVAGKSVRTLQLGALTLDLDGGVVRAGRLLLSVSAAEFGVLNVLLTNRNVPMSKDRIAVAVFGPDHGRDPRQIDMFVARLRRCFAPAGLDHLIATVAGRGYAVLDERGATTDGPPPGARSREMLAA